MDSRQMDSRQWDSLTLSFLQITPSMRHILFHFVDAVVRLARQNTKIIEHTYIQTYTQDIRHTCCSSVKASRYEGGGGCTGAGVGACCC